MKRVLVTGANRGLGLELVRQCLERGDRVFAGCRQPAQAADLQSLAREHPAQLTVLTLDVTEQEILEVLKAWMQPGDWILVKGSRSMKMETIIFDLLNNENTLNGST